jgi:hypothetical protein
VEQCEFWLDAQCGLVSAECNCEGNEAKCIINGASISSVLKKQELESIKEDCLRSLKRAHKHLN